MRKLLSIVLCATLVAGSVSIPANAYNSDSTETKISQESISETGITVEVPEYGSGATSVEYSDGGTGDEIADSSEEQIYGMGVLPDKIKIDDPVIKPSKDKYKAPVRAINLPSKYDGRDEGLVTTVKNQGKFGSCWAFGSNATMESSLIKSGLADNTLDLSELHTIYFMYNENIDEKNRISGDRNYISADAAGTPTTDFTVMANMGGYLSSEGWQAANGAIPCVENGDNYNKCAADSNYTMDQSLCFSSDYRVKNMFMCNFNEENIGNIKKLVYEYGGVVADFYCEQTTTTTSSSKYFKIVDGEKTYYNPEGSSYGANHAIEIVGWDDNYPKENFQSAPAADGAWLVKNSWGTESNHNGYVWLSYYNVGENADAVAYEFELNNPNEYVYQYDGSDLKWGYYDNADYTAYMLAFYTADAAGEGKSEIIRKVGVGLGANATYTVSILLDPVVSDSKLKYSKELGITECSNTFAGYGVNELSEPVEVKSGQTFAVCVKVDPGTKLYFARDITTNAKGKIGAVESVEEGQYYFGASTNYIYKPSGSFIIKAISDISTYSGTKTISLDQNELNLDWGDIANNSEMLKATITPADTYGKLNWVSSDTSVATVTPSENGDTAVVNAISDGQCTITAMAFDSSIKATCTVTVHNESQDNYIVQQTKSGDLYWYINKNGVLVISGTGDYEKSGDGFYGYGPWKEYADKITSAVVSVKGITDMMYMFDGCSNMTSVTFKGSDTSKVKNIMGLFSDCEKLTDIDFTDFSTESCENMGNMFENCKALESVDVSRFDTSLAYYMHSLFSGCSSLKEVDVSNFVFNYNNSINFNYWLDDCYDLEKITVPAKMPQEAKLPVKNKWYWINTDGDTCTEIVTDLDHGLTYYKHKPVSLAKNTLVTLKSNELTYGQELSELEFDEVSFVEEGTSTKVAGKLEWKKGDNKPYITDTEAEWVFTPDEEIYDPIEGTVLIKVNKILNAPNTPEALMHVPYNVNTVGQISLDGDWEWNASDKEKELSVGTAVSAAAEYKGADAEIYENVIVNVSITRSECEHTDLAEHKTASVAAKCEKEGNVEYYTCPECGKLFLDEEGTEEITASEIVTAATGHRQAQPVKENEVAATCEKAGSYEEVVYCSVCNKELSRESKVTEPLGHKEAQPVKENEVAATCEAAGSYDEVVYCSVCGDELGRDKKTVGEPLGHKKAQPVKENEVAATCEAAGSYDEVVYCSVCDKELSRESKVTEPLGHKQAHPVKENEVAATCEKAGSYEKVVYCSVCEKEFSRESKAGEAALGHAWDDGEITTKPTCEEKGVKTYTCTRCGKTRIEDVDELGQAWDDGEITTKPTCEEKGVKTFTCTRCEKTRTEDVDELGHAWDDGEITTKPTCEEKGVKTYTCTRCGKTRIEDVEPLGHEYGDAIYEWSADGKACTAKVLCTRCDEILEQEKAVADGEQTKAPTYTDKGETTYTAMFENKSFETQTKIVADVPVLTKQEEPVNPGGDTGSSNNPSGGNTGGSDNPSGGNTGISDKSSEGNKTPGSVTGDDKTTESSTGNETEPAEVKSGETVTDEITGTFYTVTSTGKTATVAYSMPVSKNLTAINIPEKVTIGNTEYKVTEIKANAFKNNKKLKKITIGKNIKKIGKNAFYGCKNLKTVTVKTTLLTKKSVGKNAFKGINAKVRIKVPKKKLKAYKVILKTAGVKGKKQKITK